MLVKAIGAITVIRFVSLYLVAVFFLSGFVVDAAAQDLRGWKTNTSKRSIELDELMSGGPPKDGIPAIDAPVFVSQTNALTWLKGQEPVIAVALNGVARAYPLQILTWHEIVNDELAGVPVTVTFCPLCYAALAFDRRIEGETYSFGVSGMLRHSDMIMYDRQTETLWQQLNGEAVIGDLTGTVLTQVPAQIISFDQFRSAYPDGEVLSRQTGHARDYGKNPYAGYDDINERPFLYKGPLDKRVPPMEKVVTITINGIDKAYPHRVTRKKRVIQDNIEGQNLVIWHADGAVSALDKSRISDSKMIGSTGVFISEVAGRSLSFEYVDGLFVDRETKSEWNVAGRAIAGPLKDSQLVPVPHGNFFAFAWFVFKPETALYSDK